MSVIALIPAHNEGARIGATVEAACALGCIDRVVVIDDASSDDTAAVAEGAGAEIIRLAANRGKGGALQAGLEYARQDADVLVLLDGDLGETASQADLLVDPIVAGVADMTIATLPKPPESGGFGLVKGLARWGIRVMSGFDAAAPLSGQRALSREAWEASTPFATGYGVEVGLTVRCSRAGLRLLEVPTEMGHAATGRDLAGFVHRGRQFIQVAAALARLAVERR